MDLDQWSCGGMDGRTDGEMDKASYREASPPLRINAMTEPIQVRDWDLDLALLGVRQALCQCSFQQTLDQLNQLDSKVNETTEQLSNYRISSN